MFLMCVIFNVGCGEVQSLVPPPPPPLEIKEDTVSLVDQTEKLHCIEDILLEKPPTEKCEKYISEIMKTQ